MQYTDLIALMGNNGTRIISQLYFGSKHCVISNVFQQMVLLPLHFPMLSPLQIKIKLLKCEKNISAYFIFL